MLKYAIEMWFNIPPHLFIVCTLPYLAVTSPAAEHHHQLACAKLYCLVTEAYRCEQLAQGCYAPLPRVGLNVRSTDRKSNALPATANHDKLTYKSESEYGMYCHIETEGLLIVTGSHIHCRILFVHNFC